MDTYVTYDTLYNISTVHTYIFIYAHTHIYMVGYQPAFKKEGNPDICDDMDEPKGHYAK